MPTVYGRSSDTTGMAALRSLIEDERVNAAIAWPLVGSIVVAVVLTARNGSLLWAGLAAALAALALVPTGLRLNPAVILPWEVVALAAVPIWVRLFGAFPIAGFLTVATLALIVAVELDAYTPVEMSPRFAVAFVVLTTMAVAGLWTIAQWLSDLYLGTAFVAGKVEMMWDLVYATAFGGLAGAVFVVYFRRRDAAGTGAAGDTSAGAHSGGST